MREFLNKHLPDHETIRRNPWLRPFKNSLLHPRLWHLNRRTAAGAVAAGLFCGLIPGPFQMLGAALAALAFRVNLPLALLTTFYTNPFTIVPLYLLAYEIGRQVLGEGNGFLAPPVFFLGDFLAWSKAMEQWMLAVARPLAIGLIILADGLALAGYLITRGGWRLHILWRLRQRRAARSVR